MESWWPWRCSGVTALLRWHVSEEREVIEASMEMRHMFTRPRLRVLTRVFWALIPCDVQIGVNGKKILSRQISKHSDYGFGWESVVRELPPSPASVVLASNFCDFDGVWIQVSRDPCANGVFLFLDMGSTAWRWLRPIYSIPAPSVALSTMPPVDGHRVPRPPWLWMLLIERSVSSLRINIGYILDSVHFGIPRSLFRLLEYSRQILTKIIQ